MEYKQVNKAPIIYIKYRKNIDIEFNLYSINKSLEKKPLIKGKPHNDKLEIIIHLKLKGS